MELKEALRAAWTITNAHFTDPHMALERLFACDEYKNHPTYKLAREMYQQDGIAIREIEWLLRQIKP